MVVEDELLAEQLVESADQEEEVRRVAGVNDVEASSQQHSPREHEGREQGFAVFAHVADRGRGLGRRPIAVDVNALDDFVARIVARRARTDHGDRVAGRSKRERLLPNAAIEWDRQVLDEDQNPARSLGILCSGAPKSHQLIPSYTPAMLRISAIRTRSTSTWPSTMLFGTSWNSGAEFPITMVCA